MTVAYGLWAFDLSSHPIDSTTDAMVEYLLKTQGADGSWEFETRRPPAASSVAMTTALAIYGLKAYGPESTKSQPVAEAFSKAAQWYLESSEPVSQEDRIGRTWGEYLLRGEILDIASLKGIRYRRVDAANRPLLPGFARPDTNRLLALSDETLDRLESIDEKAWDAYLGRARGQDIWKHQHADGGWGQEPGMSSDPYATSQALLMLAQVDYGDYRDPVHERPRFRQGIEYLLDQQKEDGSWYVASRSNPVQIYFDNGDPHGRDQFISIMATSWSVAALSNYRIYGAEPFASPSQQVRARQRAEMEAIVTFRGFP